MTNNDIILSAQFKQMLGLTNNINNDSDYNSILYGCLTANSDLIVNKNSILNDLTNINKKLYNSNCYVNNNISVNSKFNVYNCNISNNTFINDKLYVSKFSFLNNTSINSTLYIDKNYLSTNLTNTSYLYIAGNALLNNITINSNLNIYGNANLNTTTCNSNLIVSGTSILNNVTILNTLFISNNCVINSDLSISSFLYNSGITIINQNVSLISNLYVSNNTLINRYNYNNNISFLSNVNVKQNLTSYNINTNIITLTNIPEYLYNMDAVIGGVPLWGWYRTGNILKIRTDVIGPSLQLNGTNPMNLYVGQTYNELGITATDNLDNTISNIVISGNINIYTPGAYTLTYTATDSYNNSNSISRIINIALDNIIPTISLNGLNPIKLQIGNTYTESGITAIDYLGNNLSPIITGTVNTSQIGKYLLTYTVTDYSGNSNSIIRTIYVLNSNNSSAYQMNNPITYLYLTNDYNSISISQYWTIETWIYLTSYQNCMLVDFRNIPTTINTGRFALIISSTGSLGYYYELTNEYIYCNSSINIALNNWTHIVYQRNGLNMEFYINGILIGTLLINTLFDNPNISNLNQIVLGHSANLPLSNSWHLLGSISQLKISIEKKYSNNFIPNNDLSYNISNTLFLLGDNYYDIISNTQMTSSGTFPIIWNKNIYINLTPTNIELRNLLFNFQVSNLPSTNTTWSDTTNNYQLIVHPNANNYNSLIKTQNNNGWKRTGNIGWTLNSSSNNLLKNQNWLNGYTLEQWIYIDFDFIPSSSMLLFGSSSLFSSNDYGFIFSPSNFSYNSYYGNILAFSTNIILTNNNTNYPINIDNLRGQWNHIVVTSSVDNTISIYSNDSTKILSSLYPNRSNSNNQLNIYINGNLIISLNNSQWTNWSNPGLSGNVFSIGCNSNNGNIDSNSLNKIHFGNTRMYNRILFQDEIINNYYYELLLYQNPTNDIYFIKNPNIISSNFITNYDFTNGWLSQTIDLNKLRIATNWTIECWAYATSWGGNNDAGWIVDLSSSNKYLAFGITTNIGNISPSITYDGKGRPFIYYSNDTISQWKINNSLTVDLNKWNHIAWQKNNNTTLEMFVNGISTGTFNINSNEWLFPTFVSNFGLNNIVIGASTINLNSSTNHWKGKLSQVKITIEKKYNNNFIPLFDLSINGNGLFLLQDNFINNSIGKSMNNNNNVIIPNYSKSTINLNGLTLLNLFMNMDTYTELGYIYDYYIRSNSLELSTTGIVDTSTVGTYIIVYSIIDSLNNITFAKRTINVIKYNILPIITLNGSSTMYLNLYLTFNDPGVTITNNINQIITPIIVGNVNTSQLGSYTLTYIATDMYDNSASVSRVVNIINDLPLITYDVTKGFLGPLISSNINNTDWTMECWVYQTIRNSFSIIFDFRFINPYYSNYTLMTYIQNNGSIAIFNNEYLQSATSQTNNTITLNKWTHIAWMRKNNNIYGFINGIGELIATNPSWINNLYPLNSITLCVDTNYNTNNQMSTFKYIGNISQPLIITTSKYDITGFTPQWNLRPSNMSNVLYWLDNGIDNYSYQSLTLNKTVNTNSITNPLLPIITLSGNNPFYLSINNTFTDPGATATSYLTGSAISYTTTGTVDITTLGTYNITYTATDANGTSTITRTVYIINTQNTTNIYYNTTNGYFTSANNITISSSNNKYTFEVWVYLNSGSLRNIVFDSRGSGYSSNIFVFGIFNNYTSSSTAFNQMTGSTQIQFNKWTHIAWVINYPDVKVYVNGKLDISYTSDLTYIVSNLIIANNSDGNALFRGYIYNASIHKSIKYTTNFTPASPIKITTDTIFYLGNDYKNSITNTILPTFGTITTDIIPTIQYYSNDMFNITLNGNTNTSILIYSTYTELGVTAKDIFGNVLTYTTSGTVNTNQAGTYTITYIVNNIYGTFTATRNVSVFLSSNNLPLNIFLWLDSTNIPINNIIYSSGTIISNLIDNSGNNITFTNLTGNPKITNNIINNKPVFDFTNGGSLRSNNVGNSKDLTIAVIVKFSSSINSWGVVWGHFQDYGPNSSTGHDRDICIRNNSGYMVLHLCNYGTSDNNFNMNNLYNNSYLMLGTATNATQGYWQMINLNTGVSNSISFTVSSTLQLGDFPIFLGSSEYINNNELAQCYIGECIYWKRVLTNTEQNDTILYLLSKWSTLTTYNNQSVPIYNNTQTNIQTNNSIKPTLTLIGPSIIYLQLNDTYNELGITGKDVFNTNISTYTTSGSVNTTSIGQYILTYTATDTYGVSNSITRTINIIQDVPIFSYNITNGFLGPLLNNYNILNNNNWTIEAWINQSYIYPSSNYVVLFDFRSYPYVANNFMAIILSTDNKLGILSYTGQTFYSTITITLNQWTHVVWMRSGINVYAFINGVSNLLCSNQSWLNSLTNLNSVLIGADSNLMTSSSNIKNNLNKFYGYIAQPLITTNARYNITGFTPQWILKPSSNILFWLNNTLETISNKYITFQNTVISNILSNPILPVITLNGSSKINLLVNSTYTELGATINYILNPTISYTISGTIDPTTLGTYILTYTTANNLTSITRTINVTNMINVTTYDTTNGNLQLTGLNFNSLSNNDWTIECWLNINNKNTSGNFGFGSTIIDFRQPGNNTANIPPEHMWLSIDDNTYMPRINNMSISQSFNINYNVTLNNWYHYVWMRYNNQLYVFINGICSSPNNLLSNMNNFTQLYYIVIGVFNDWINDSSSTYNFKGNIYHPLITLGAKYSINGFTPLKDLTPSDYTNVLYFLNNDLEVKSNRQIILNRTVVKNTLSILSNSSSSSSLSSSTTLTISSISLNGSNNLYILQNTNYYELDAFALVNNNISSYTVSGNVDVTNIGQYTLTYTINDKSINRIVNVINNSLSINSKSSYTLNASWLGPIKNTYNLNNNDWTFEIWLNCTSYSTYAFIFDSGDPTTTSWTGKLGLCINSNGYLFIYTGSNNNYVQVSQTQVQLNTWTHVVWMKNSNNIYSFINGICSNSTTVYSQLNTLTQFNNMSFGCSVNDLTNASYRFNGTICQPLISSYAKYNISGFIPQWDLISTTNVLLYINNDIDIITNQSIIFNNNVSKTILNTIPYTSSTISLIGNNNYNISLNSKYIEPGVINSSFTNQTFYVYITSIKNSNNNELLTNYILVNGKYTNININTSLITTYTITYSSVNNNGIINTIQRTISITNNLPIISYDVSNGFLGPIIKNNINKINWTIECWIYQTSNNNNNNTQIFDFRYTNPYNETYGFYTYINNSNNKIGLWSSNSGQYLTSTNTIQLNKWTHLVWMCYNNNIYTFINGVSSLIGTNQTWTTNLISLNSISISIDTYWKYYNNNNNIVNNKYYGLITQPLIIKTAKYNINGFIPKWDLKPLIYSNVIFWLENNIDKISNQSINIQSTVIQNFLTSSPIVPILTLNGSSSVVVEITNIYTDLGATVYYPLNQSIIVYITSIIDQNNIEYITTPLNALSTNTINNLNTNLLNYIYTITYSVTDLNNNIFSITRTLTISLLPIGITFYSTSKPNVYATTSTKTSNTIYYYGYNNGRYTSTDFVKLTFNSDIIYYMDSNQVVSSNIVTTDSNGILWTTIGLITMQVYNPMNYSINYNSNTYSLYFNPNLLLMSNGIYKNNNGSDYVYQYNNNWYSSIDMITFYKILFDPTNTIVQGVSSTDIIYVYNNIVLTTQPLVHTLNNIDYWIFEIIRANPNNLSDYFIYYNNIIYMQASPAYLYDGGFSYIPTYIAPDWPINSRTSSSNMANQFRNGERFDNRVIIFLIGLGFITGTNKLSYFDTGVIPSSEPGRSVVYKIKSDGTLDSVNIFYSFWTYGAVYYSSKCGYMTCPGFRNGPGYNNHTVSDGNFSLKFGNAGSLTVTRIIDNFSKSFTYLSFNCKMIGYNSFQYIIWIGSSSNFDPHAIFDCSPYFNNGGYGYISFETNSYFRPMEWNGGNPNAPSWNGDINQFLNGPISVSCKNLNSCSYINPKCLENYNLTGPIIAATGGNTILTQSIATQQNSNINVINGNPTAVGLPISNYSTVGFTSLIYNNNTYWYAVAVPASRTAFFISNVNQFLSSGNTLDLSYTGQFITNLLTSKYWNNY